MGAHVYRPFRAGRRWMDRGAARYALGLATLGSRFQRGVERRAFTVFSAGSGGTSLYSFQGCIGEGRACFQRSANNAHSPSTYGVVLLTLFMILSRKAGASVFFSASFNVNRRRSRITIRPLMITVSTSAAFVA